MINQQSSNSNNTWSSLGKGIVGSAAGSLIGGLSSSLFSRLNAKWQYRQTRKYAELQDEFNKRAFDREADFSREMYERQFNDQLPSAVRKRLEEAGLNPAVFFSNGQNAGSTPSILGASSSASDVSPFETMPIPGYSPGSESAALAASGKTTAETPTNAEFRANLRARTAASISESGSLDASAALTRYERYYRVLTQDTNVNTLRQNFRNMILEGNRLLTDSLLTYQRYRTEVFNTRLADKSVSRIENELRLQSLDIVEHAIRNKIRQFELTNLLPAQWENLRAQAYSAMESAATEGTRRLLYHSEMDLNDASRDNYRAESAFTAGVKSRYYRSLTAKTDADREFIELKAKWYPVETSFSIANETANTINQYIRTYKWSPKSSGKGNTPTISAKDIMYLYRTIHR